MMNFKNTKSALILGIVNGLLFFAIYQPVKIFYVKYLWYIKDDDYVHVALPQIYRIAHDVSEILIWTILFTLATYTVHKISSSKSVSTISLWLLVAILSIGIPVICLWIFPVLIVLFISIANLFSICFFPLACHKSLNELLPMLIRESVDIKFELLLFIVAITLNYFYGLAIKKMSKNLDFTKH